jgi:hypothetical protein
MKRDNSIPAEARFTIAKERVLQLNDYCERGLRNVAAACQLWNQIQIEPSVSKRLQLLDSGELFLQNALLIVRDYARQMPDPNKLKQWLGAGEEVDELLKALNGLGATLFQFTELMEEMKENCARLRRQLEKGVMNLWADIKAAA